VFCRLLNSIRWLPFSSHSFVFPLSIERRERFKMQDCNFAGLFRMGVELGFRTLGDGR